MEASRKPRGRLSRRRPPSGDRLPRPPSARPWFLLGDGESEPWAALLRTVSADLTLDGGALPPLPVFPGQESQPGPERAAPPEVFTVGSKTFSWTPFPPAPQGAGSFYPLPCGAGRPLESPTRSPKGSPAPNCSRTPSTQKQLSEQGPPALQSCPMCQKKFAPELSQLDVDSHLAQCLAEGTEDVMW
uniref:Fanconi anemia core complex-associated protein 20 n=1 Tax=Castor canadensis TaxID=51338 RepID=A0A8B7V8A6_CASCN|nr:Fanconi anemia core complex-associated protein 20 [Castor canadensis]